MRPELEKLEWIEKYLLNELSSEELIEFEKMRREKSILEEEILEVKNIINAVKSSYIKSEINNAFSNYKLMKVMKMISVSLVIVVGVLATLYFLNNPKNNDAENKILNENKIEIDNNNQKITSEKIDDSLINNFEENEIKETVKEKYTKHKFISVFPEIEDENPIINNVEKNIPSYFFDIKTDKDTVISTSNLIVYIPAHSFVNKDGQETSNAKIEIKEAIEAADIMKAGLNTEGENGLLETAGMFFINASENQNDLKIIKDITVQIATNNVDAEMKLFDGERQNDGTILWKNPTNIAQNPMPIDMNLLDFYPPKYLDTLSSYKDIKNKKYTDSLYYSFAYLFENPSKTPAIKTDKRKPRRERRERRNKIKQNNVDTGKIDPIFSDGLDYVNPNWNQIIGINPANVKGFWNAQYNNTLLATKEFEERMPFIHQSCNNEILNLYINNLDKNLYEVDEMVAKMLDGNLKNTFQNFASQKTGKVEIDINRSEALSRFYKRTKDEQTKIAKEVYQKYMQELNDLKTELRVKKSEQVQKDFERKQNNFNKEFQINLDDAYRQAGLPKPLYWKGKRVRNYRVSIRNMGWKNLDKYVFEATKKRETLDIVWKGRKVKLTYEKVEVILKEKFEKTYCYLLPDKLNSFERMNKTTETNYSFSMNMLLKYDLCVVAYKDGKWYQFLSKNIKPGTIETGDFSLLNEDELNSRIDGKLNESVVNNLKEDMEFNIFEIKQNIEINSREKHLQFIEKIKKVIFPCYEGGDAPQILLEKDILIEN